MKIIPNQKHLFAFVSLFTLFLQNVIPAYACGPFILDPLFSFTRHPDYPLTDYNRGNVGVVPTTFGRISLYVFYRQLNDLPFTPAEQNQVAEAMKKRIGVHWQDEIKSSNNTNANETSAPPNYLKLWQDTRAKVMGEDQKVSADKMSADDYSYEYNCLPDAFKTAAQTLEARLSVHGNNENVKKWVAAQDVVFKNCSGSGTVPDASNADFPDWLKQDRQYQIAAALFYQDKFAEARAAFEQSAADSQSPWSKTARFVIARTYIREASSIDIESPDYEPVTTNINQPQANTNTMSNSLSNTNLVISNSQASPKIVKSIDEKKRQRDNLLKQAYEDLQKIISDTAMSEFHSSAQRLSNLVKYRLNPIERRQALAQILTNSGENKNIYNDLTDYIWLLDSVQSDAASSGMELELREREKSGKNDYSYEYALKIRDVPAQERGADLTDWLFSYQSTDSFSHAVDKWRTTQKNAWLVLALVKADAKSSQLPELLAAADKVPVNSKAYATARYHQIRLLQESGNRVEARRKLDEVFAANFAKNNASTQNKFYAQRMALAENLNDFLKYAQRRPATFVWSDDANEEGTDLTAPAVFDEKDISNKKLRAWAGKTMFDDDAVAFINEKMPLSVMRQAALSTALPEHLKKFLIIAVWTRAFVLNNQSIEREFAPLMLKFAPEYQPFFSKYVAASGVNREAAGLIAVLRYPVIQPFVPVGYGRDDSTPDSIDSIRGNWWCVKNISDEYERDYYDHWDFQHPKIYPDFLTAAQAAEAELEQKQLIETDNSATYLTRRALEFAKANPAHPQIPEILHLAVRSTRFACKDSETGTFSKRAFDLLHQRYKASSWTKQTPYWFGL